MTTKPPTPKNPSIHCSHARPAFAILPGLDSSPPTSGTGRCYACDCKGYRKGSELNWCKCGHHRDRHS